MFICFRVFQGLCLFGSGKNVIIHRVWAWLFRKLAEGKFTLEFFVAAIVCMSWK